MKKDFDRWNDIKKDIHNKKNLIKFRQRDIIFINMGVNIGYEQNGKGEKFLRPVLVYKKFNSRVFLGIPLTSKKKIDKFHFEFDFGKDKKSYAILSQMRLFDIKRAVYKNKTIKEKQFAKLEEKIIKLMKVTPLQKEGERAIAICKNIIPQKDLNVNMQKDSKIYIAGGTGLVGSAIIKNLLKKGYKNIISNYYTKKPTHYLLSTINYHQLDLTDQQAVEQFFKREKPEFVFLAAAKVGGIVANNTYRAEFIYQNLQIQNNVIHQSYLNGVKKLLFLGSTCIYPKNSPQPMKEEYLLTSELEYTNEPYAIAKIAGIKMCESYNLQYGTNFISVMPTNLYGKNDNFDLEKSHVLPALIRKVYLGKCLEENNWDAIAKDLGFGIEDLNDKEKILRQLDKYGIKLLKPQTSNLNPISIEIWGSGKPRREFLYSEDMADACVFIMEKRDFKDTYKDGQKEIRNTHINIGTGEDISIKELAYMIKKIIGFKGEFYFNTQKPDGTMVKLTDPSKLHSLGWRHKIKLEDGIKMVYEWYLKTKQFF